MQSVKKIKCQSKRYDIQTAKNHNFFANNILVHNSLGILYHWNGEWNVATRGSFQSEQAQWAESWLKSRPEITAHFNTNVTYLCEIIYAANRIVISYPFEGLVLLGAYDRFYGFELDYDKDLMLLAHLTGMRIAERKSFNSFEDALEFVKTLPGDQEGFVIRFKGSGKRVKIKGTEYCTLHKMISNITPLGIWELMTTGYDMEGYKRSMPEEFWDSIDSIHGHLQRRLDGFIAVAEELAGKWSTRTDKELGLAIKGELKNTPGAEYIFTLRKKGLAAVRAQILKNIRPTGNVIEGYSPSTALLRAQQDE